jgi:hypothetical protein
VNWPAAAGLYFVIATVRAADDSNTTNDVKAGHAAAVGTYRYAEVQGFDNSGTGPKVNGPNDAKTSDTGLNGATQLGVGQTLAIEGVMDATGEYDTYKFTTSNSVSAVLYARTMWSTGLDDIDFHIWDQVTTTDFFSNSAGIDTEPLYSPYGVTLPSGRPCYVGVYMYMAGKTAGDPADSGKKYVVLVSLQ